MTDPHGCRFAHPGYELSRDARRAGRNRREPGHRRRLPQQCADHRQHGDQDQERLADALCPWRHRDHFDDEVKDDAGEAPFGGVDQQREDVAHRLVSRPGQGSESTALWAIVEFVSACSCPGAPYELFRPKALIWPNSRAKSTASSRPGTYQATREELARLDAERAAAE